MASGSGRYCNRRKTHVHAEDKGSQVIYLSVMLSSSIVAAIGFLLVDGSGMQERGVTHSSTTRCP